MRILQLCPKPPRPARDGGCRAMDALTMALLESGYEVRVFAIETEKHPALPSEFSKSYLEQTRFESVPVKTALHPIDALAHLLTWESYNISRFHSPTVEDTLRDILRRELFDVILFESLFMAPYLHIVGELSDAPCVLRAHNVEHRVWATLARQTPGLTRRLYLRALTQQLATYEKRMLNAFDGIAAISPEDRAIFLELGATVPIEVIQFGVDVYWGPVETMNHVYHLGAMDWQPNLQGVQWLLTEVWPRVLARSPEAKLVLAGKAFPAHLPGTDQAGITVLGEVDDAGDFLQGAGIALVPLLSGSGIRIKAIESMAYGKAIISTGLGVEGLGLTHGKDVIIADTPTAFAEAIAGLLDNPARAASLGSEARTFARNHFSHAAVTSRILTFLNRMTA